MAVRYIYNNKNKNYNIIANTNSIINTTSNNNINDYDNNNNIKYL